jgi:hypothetical protein
MRSRTESTKSRPEHISGKNACEQGQHQSKQMTKASQTIQLKIAVIISCKLAGTFRRMA